MSNPGAGYSTNSQKTLTGTPIGGGNPFGPAVCPPGYYVNEIYGTGYISVDKFGFKCSDGTTGSPVWGSQDAGDHDVNYDVKPPGGLPYGQSYFDGFTLTNSPGDSWKVYGLSYSYPNSVPSFPSTYISARAGNTAYNVAQLYCPKDMAVVGFSGSAGAAMNQITPICNYQTTVACSDNLFEQNDAGNWCQGFLDPNPDDGHKTGTPRSGYYKDLSRWQKIVKNYCGQPGKMAPGSQCHEFMYDHPGEYDDFMQNWCASNPTDPLCACYQPPSGNLPPELAAQLSNDPRCYSGLCTTQGYRQQSLIGDPTCKPITYCASNQTTSGSNNIISTKQQIICNPSSTGDNTSGGNTGSIPTTSTSSNTGNNNTFTDPNAEPATDYTIYYILIVAVAIILAGVYLSLDDDNYYQQYGQSYGLSQGYEQSQRYANSGYYGRRY
jgi:hypothetical protein